MIGFHARAEIVSTSASTIELGERAWLSRDELRPENLPRRLVLMPRPRFHRPPLIENGLARARPSISG